MKSRISRVALLLSLPLLLVSIPRAGLADITIGKGFTCSGSTIVKKNGKEVSKKVARRKVRRALKKKKGRKRKKLRKVLAKINNCTKGELVPNPNFVPFDEQDRDYYSFEVSDLSVYNLEFSTSSSPASLKYSESSAQEVSLLRLNTDAVKSRLKGKQDDVLQIVGTGPGSFGIAIPKRVGFGRVAVQANLGIVLDNNGQLPDGVIPGSTFAAVEVDVKDSDPLNYVFGGALPSASGITTFGQNQDGNFPTTFFYPDIFEVEVVVNRGFLEIGGMPMEQTIVKSRPAGSNAAFDIILDDLTSVSEDPFSNGLIGSWGVSNLDDGGSMFIDDVSTFNLRDPASASVTSVIDQAFDDEIEAFVMLAQDPQAAKALIESAMSDIAQAEAAISQGSFQAGTRSADALSELVKAREFDQQALDAIAKGDTGKAGQALIEGSTAKARAELFLEGHNPQPGPFPDGTGGFDNDDPFIFADGFESGDVSAWSTGDQFNSAPAAQCLEGDDITLCLPGNARFKATVEWKDFVGNTGSGMVSESLEDSGTFSFLDSNNSELLVQLLDKCSENNHFWVFYSATTDVEFTLSVADTKTGLEKDYFNPLGTPAAPITDTSAFATCP